MSTIVRKHVINAMNRLRTFNFVRERALQDEVSFLHEAKCEGFQRGHDAGREKVPRNLLARNPLIDEQIAAAAGLTSAAVKALRDGAA